MLDPRHSYRDATEEDIVRFYGPIEFSRPWVAKVIRRGSLIAGFGGLLEIEDGKWIAFFEVPAHLRKPHVFRYIKQAFDEAFERGAVTVIAKCSTHIEGAERLMRHLGFQPTDEEMDGEPVWKLERLG